MAGFSIMLLIFIFWPFMLAGLLLVIAFEATVEFVTSPAFPVLIVSLVFSGLALVDVLRTLWRHYRERTLRAMRLGEFVRPAVLCGIAFALFVVVCVMAGSMAFSWYQSLGELESGG